MKNRLDLVKLKKTAKDKALDRIRTDYLELKKDIVERFEKLNGWNYAGEYSEKTVYKLNDIVRADGKLYLSLKVKILILWINGWRLLKMGLGLNIGLRVI